MIHWNNLLSVILVFVLAFAPASLARERGRRGWPYYPLALAISPVVACVVVLVLRDLRTYPDSPYLARSRLSGFGWFVLVLTTGGTAAIVLLNFYIHSV